MLDDMELQRRFRERDASIAPCGDDLFRRIMTRIDAAPANAPLRWSPRHWPAPFAYAAAAAIVLLVGFFFLPRSTTTNKVALQSEGQKVEDATTNAAPVSAPAAPAPPAAVAPLARQMQAASGSAAAKKYAGALGADPFGTSAGLARTSAIDVFVADVSDALRLARAIAKRSGGTVTTLNDAAPDVPNAPRRATLTIVVPAQRLDAASNDLASLGAVRSHSTNAESVGGSIVDSAARLRNLRSEERDLLAIMQRSGRVSDILEVETTLSEVRGSIEQLEGQLATLEHRVATASIDVTLTERRSAAQATVPGLSDSMATSWNAAVRASSTLAFAIAGSVLWLVAFIPYVAVIGAIAGVLWWRRRHE